MGLSLRVSCLSLKVAAVASLLWLAAPPCVAQSADDFDWPEPSATPTATPGVPIWEQRATPEPIATPSTPLRVEPESVPLPEPDATPPSAPKSSGMGVRAITRKAHIFGSVSGKSFEPNGSPINVVVGQRIVLFTWVETKDSDRGLVGYEGNNYKWTIPGANVGDWLFPDDQRWGKPFPLYYYPKSSGIPGIDRHFWVTFCWTSAGRKLVKVSFKDKVGKTHQVSVTFNVKKPQFKIETKVGPVTVQKQPHDGKLVWVLQFGNFKSGTRGITFTAKPIRATTGSYEWCQVVHSIFITYIYQNGQRRVLTGFGLDNVFPYPVVGRNPLRTEDNPNNSIEIPGVVRVERRDSFTMTLMYKPGLNDIWVPLRKVDWSWYAVAKKTSSGWVLASPPNVKPPTESDTTKHPTWSNKFTNLH